MNKENIGEHILVIGGTGFIGSNLVRFLVKNGHEVIVYHRKESNLKNLDGVKFKSALGDLTDKNAIEKTLFSAMDGCKAVYNLATCPSSLKKYHRLREIVNIEATGIVAKVARQIGNLRLIHISSSTVVGYPDKKEIADENFGFNAYNDHYAYTKYLGEQAVLKEVTLGLDAVIAIPCSAMGSQGMKVHQLNVFKNIARGKMRIYPPGGLCLTYIDDIVKGLVLCYEKGITGKRYILGGSNITYKQYFNEIAHATGGKAPYIRLPKTILPWLGLTVETLFKFLNREITISKNVGEMISKNLFYSSDYAKKELGYTITDWKEAIKNTVKQLKI